MDLRTTYLGIELPHPLVSGASPLADDLGTVRRLEDAGAAAIVLRSLFEEQIVRDEISAGLHLYGAAESYAEALTYLPKQDVFALGPFEYLDHLRRLRAAVAVPLVASLNGSTLGGWLDYARFLEDAGADAIELNVYRLPVAVGEDAVDVERDTVDMVRAVRQTVSVPLAVKLSPFYTSLPALAVRLREAGADGLVLFNRFMQPDLDVEELKVVPSIELSDPSELRLRLRWLAILSTSFPGSLAASGGVHDVTGVIKAVMAGAHAVQLVSVILRRGPACLARMRSELAEWLESHEYASLRQMQGSMNLAACPNPGAYERANYVKILQSWHGE
jgi:dihydroorotate dehydrogenase (fumarate)